MGSWLEKAPKKFFLDFAILALSKSKFVI